MKNAFWMLAMGLLLFGCGSKRKAVEHRPEDKKETIDKPEDIAKDVKEDIPKPVAAVTNSTTTYILAYKDIAMEEMRSYNIPASITLAQGILESGSGKGRLAVQANNHFGIKCHDWNGPKIYHDDDRSQECFRKYKNSGQSFRDHSDFLVNRKRYGNLFKLKKDDYRAWAKELRRAGYATDRRYPQKLIALIERYELYKFDAAVLGNKMKTRSTYTIVKGDTLYSISRRFNVAVEDLQAWNDLEDTNLRIGQVLKITSKPNK